MPTSPPFDNSASPSRQTSNEECTGTVLESIFRATFFQQYNTLLRGGAEEPLYQPASSAGQPHLIYYREDYPASALHEIAHWCLAGAKRRQQLDFGYWYLPDGRSAEQQRLFEQVEVKPQALEWLFSAAAGHRFHLSVDNLNGEGQASPDFVAAVCQQAQDWCRIDPPRRGAMFIRALWDYFATEDVLNPARYQPHRIAGF